MAADNSVEGKNVLVWRLSGNSIWQWEFDESWTALIRGFGSLSPSNSQYYLAEVGYGVDFDGNGVGS
jgi:hypothetical protein